MNNYGFFDFETHWSEIEQKPVCCAQVWKSEKGDGKNYITDKAPWTRWDWVAEQTLSTLAFVSHNREVAYWYAHNMGKYDGLYLSAAAQRMGWKQEAILAGGGRPIEWRFWNGTYEVVCRDSYAIVDSALEAAANDFELDTRKLFTKSDYRVSPRDWSDELREKGCFADCYAGMELLEKVETFVHDWQGEMRSTFSGIALSIIKKNIETEIPQLPHLWNLQAMKAYYGARVEILHHRPEYKLSEYDLNSSYPAAMCKEMPWEPLREVEGREAQVAFANGAEGIFRAQVTVSEDSRIPPLPFRIPCNECLKCGVSACTHTRRNAIYFPTGSWVASFPANELRFALSQGVSIKVLEGMVYSSKSPFDSFVRRVYELKATSRGAKREFCKKVLNGGYGKFGQRPTQSTLKVFESAQAMREYAFTESGKLTKLGALAGTVEIFRWPKHTHYAVAAYVTAGARIALAEYMLRANGVAAVDADALHCERGALEEFVSNELGAMKLEIDNYSGEFFAPKMYRLTQADGKRRYACKGFEITCEKCRNTPKKERPNPCPLCDANFDKVATGSISRKERMRLIKTQLRAEDGKVCKQFDDKVWRGHSTKRKACYDGSTQAWSIAELMRGMHDAQFSPLFPNAQQALF